jgi:hypothetical protein
MKIHNFTLQLTVALITGVGIKYLLPDLLLPSSVVLEHFSVSIRMSHF